MDNGLDYIYDKIREKICQKPLEKAYIRAEFEDVEIKEWYIDNQQNCSRIWEVILKDKTNDYFTADRLFFNGIDMMLKSNYNSRVAMDEIRQLMADKINEGIDKVLELRNRKKGDNDE